MVEEFFLASTPIRDSGKQSGNYGWPYDLEFIVYAGEACFEFHVDERKH